MHIPGWSCIPSVLTVNALVSPAQFAANDTLAAPTAYAEPPFYASSRSHTALLRYQRVINPTGEAPYLRSDQNFFPTPSIGSVEAASGVRIRRRVATVNAALSWGAKQNRLASLFARAYANAFHFTLGDARTRLQADNLSLYQGWATLTSAAQIDVPPAASVLSSSAAGRAHAAAMFAAYLQAEPDTEDEAAISIAQSYLRRLAPTALDQPARAALYQAVLQRGLQWIDMTKVDSKKLSATHILQTVCRHRKVALNTRSVLIARLRHERDVIIDEAALIAAHAGQAAADTSMAQMRAQFATALIDEWQDAALAQLLLPSSVLPPEHTQFWYDGSIMRNTRGKGLEQIVSALYVAAPQAEDYCMQLLITQANRRRYLLGQADGLIAATQRQRLTDEMHGDSAALVRYASRPNSLAFGGVWLTRDELYAIVEKSMRDLALDIDYPSGTPLHAIATIVYRLGPLHGIDFDAYNNPSALMAAYNRLEAAWQYSPHYPIKPSLCAAHFLAQTSDVLLLDAASNFSCEQKIAHQVAAALLPALQQAGHPLTSQSNYWNSTITLFSEHKFSDNIERKAGFSAGRPSFIGGPASVLPAQKRAIYASLEAQIKALKSAPETMHYAGTESLDHQLDAYLKQRLLAQAPLPTYDENFVIEQILRQQLMMSDTDLQTKRRISRFNSGSSALVPSWVVREMTPHEEFKELAHSLHPMMRFKGRGIDTAKTLNVAKRQALAGLLRNPLIAAKAREILRQHASVNAPSHIDELGSVLAHSIIGLPNEASVIEGLSSFLNALFKSSTMSTIVTAFSSGEPRQMLALLPFIVPLYDIEEGLRRGHWERAFDGALHFGEDALFTLLGAAVEGQLRKQLTSDAESMLLARSRMSPGERAGVDMAQDMAQLFPQASSERLAQRRVVVDEDVFNVGAPTQAEVPTQTLPKILEAQRQPDNHVHQTLYLADENRIVLVQPAGSGLAEANLRGQLVLAAPPIFGSLKSGRGYRLSRHSGLPGGTIGVEKSTLLLRTTVSSVQRFWASVAGLRNIRIRRAEPKAIINALFRNAGSDPYDSYAAFERFWLKAYARSDTAVVILNAAYDRLIACGNYCEIEFNAVRARVRGDNISFLDAEGLAKLQYVALDGMENFQRERMWTHESIHWTTKLGDALEGDASDSRGATPYLTDRILSEIGAYPPLLQRIAYKAPPAFEADEIAHRVWSGRLRTLYDWNIAENNVLDSTLNMGRDFSPGLWVLGQKISDRITVRQGVALSEHIKSLGTFGAGNAEYLLQQVRAAFTASSWPHNRLAMLRSMMEKSATFRILSAAWSRTITYQRVAVEFNKFDVKHAGTSLSQPLAHHVAAGGKKVWLNSQPLYYFSDFDMTALSDTRRYAGAMIDLFLRGMIPAEQKLRLPNGLFERGLGVLLEDEVLRQIGIDEPRRINARLTENPDAYFRHQTTTTRAAVSEDGYLQQVCRGASSSAADDILALSN